VGGVALVLVLTMVFTARRHPEPIAAIAECQALYDSARTLRDTLLADRHLPRVVTQSPRSLPTTCFDFRSTEIWRQRRLNLQ
jgi:hypothetical protein